MSVSIRSFFYKAAVPLLFLAPTVASAGTTEPNLEYFGSDGASDGLVQQFGALVNAIIPVLFALALLLFVWGVINYFILGAGDEGKRETGRSYMLYAIIGLVAITAVWGIVNLLAQILGVGGNYTAPTQPTAPTP